MDNPSEKLQAAIEAISIGAEIALAHFGNDELKVKLKQDSSVVTPGDLITQKAMIEYIVRRYPEDLIIAEEKDNEQFSHRNAWIIDPIDGTKEYSRGIDSWGMHIAIVQEGEIIAGVVYFPVRKTMLIAEKGKGAFLNDRKITVSKVEDPKRTFVSVSPLGYMNQKERHAILNVATKFGSMRSATTSLAGSFVSEGKMDVYIGSHHNRIWDNAPFVIIATEAGGRVTDWSGNNVDISAYDSPIVISNGLVHEELLACLK